MTADIAATHGHPASVASGDSALDGRTDIIDAARAVGVVDALLFRRVSPTSWAHLGGLGRGRGWAGIIDLNDADEPLIDRIPSRSGDVHRVAAVDPIRILGPYYARSAVVVRTRPDVAVILGNPDGALTGIGDDDDAPFVHLASLLDAAIDDVLPSKRLADELEVLHTVRSLMEAPSDRGVVETLNHVVSVVTSALTCEIGVLRDATGRLTVVSSESGQIPDETWNRVLDAAAAAMHDDLLLAQDADAITSAAPAIMEWLPQACALLVVPVPPPVGGLLLVVHTDHGPRGFSSQCQRLCRHVIETGTIITRTAMLRDELRDAADRAARMARTDPLTGLGNRLAWDEALAAAQERVSEGATVSVVTIDVDGLKRINDAHGHPAGDRLLQSCAEITRRHWPDAEIAVRMGGDEFAILLPGETTHDDARYHAFVDELSRADSAPGSVAASVGVSTAEPGGNVFDAVRDADVEMYKHKRDRRRVGAATLVPRQR